MTLTKEEDSIINKKRSKMLVPGERATEHPEEAKLPILLMSRPPTHSAGHGMRLIECDFCLVFVLMIWFDKHIFASLETSFYLFAW